MTDPQILADAEAIERRLDAALSDLQRQGVPPARIVAVALRSTVLAARRLCGDRQTAAALVQLLEEIMADDTATRH